ncbi:MAG: prepilin-type N-terminal cleavage/methylation domain-containing protein [Elusimicrobia bacterium]|nr:prepilin-type N-terminal cleavage/methylation domain-containing protein [Elusimicrobiota bacterium]
MSLTARARGGFTLVELIMAMALGSLVIIGLSNLMVPLTRAQVYATRGLTAQMNAVAAQTAAERALREATWIGTPAAPGLPSDRLEGCANAVVDPGTDPVAMDPTRPMRWFAFCSQDGVVYEHAGDGCPPRYSCGTAPQGTFGGGSLTSGATAQFTRSSAFDSVVDIDLAFDSAGVSSHVLSAVAFSAAAGTNQ